MCLARDSLLAPVHGVPTGLFEGPLYTRVLQACSDFTDITLVFTSVAAKNQCVVTHLWLRCLLISLSGWPFGALRRRQFMSLDVSRQGPKACPNTRFHVGHLGVVKAAASA